MKNIINFEEVAERISQLPEDTRMNLWNYIHEGDYERIEYNDVREIFILSGENPERFAEWIIYSDGDYYISHRYVHLTYEGIYSSFDYIGDIWDNDTIAEDIESFLDDGDEFDEFPEVLEILKDCEEEDEEEESPEG